MDDKINGWLNEIEVQLKETHTLGERLQLEWRKRFLEKQLKDYCDRELKCAGII